MKNNIRSKKKKNIQKNNSLAKGLILIGVYFVVSFLLEIINFATLGFGIFPANIMFNLAFWLIVCGLIFLIPNNTAKAIVTTLLIIVQILFNIANNILKGVTGIVFHWHQLLQTGNGFKSLDKEMFNVWLIILYIVIFVVFLITNILLNKKIRNGYDFTFHKRIAFWLSTVFTFIVVGTSFVFIGTSVRKNVQKNAYAFASDGGASLADGSYFRNATFRTMGTFGFYFHDLFCVIDAHKKASSSEILQTKEDLKTGFVDSEKAFGVSKGDNLIYILLESFDSFSLDPYNTPNLWKMAYGTASESSDKNVKWGYNFTNFYSLNYTNNSEHISLLGHATEKVTIAENYDRIGLYTPYSLPNMFKNAKYGSVNFFHSYSKEYYNRDEINKAIGFDNVYGIEDANIEGKSTEFGEWVLDSEYISAMLTKFIPEGKSFFSYFTTVGTHGPYTENKSKLETYKTTYDKNLENYKKHLKDQGYIYPEDEKTQNELRRYKTAVMDVDKMVEIIFTELERQRILDKTTVVMFSDHNCFYNDLNAKIMGVDPEEYENIQLYNVPLLIYNNDIASRSSSSFCNVYDLYPTICDMFGFAYNTKITQGYSLFNSTEIKKSINVSFKHGVFNEDYYTEDLIDIKQISSEPKMELSDFKKYAYDFFVKQELIEFIYYNNVFLY